jgi:hypothetical protein
MSNIENTENNNLIFSNWRFRCHRLGDLMTNLPGLTKSEEKKLEMLIQRDKDFKAGKEKVRPLTENMIEEMKDLIAKRDREDSLPIGAKSYLDKVFNEIYWKRKRILSNKYLDKGLMNEQDVLHLHSNIDGIPYWKNSERFYNEYLEGMPDNIFEKVRDAKANFDLESFQDADLSNLYKFQIKGYLWLVGLTQGELMYGLVNNPLHQITNAINSAYYALGCPDDDDENYIAVKQQIERNMIFDHKLFIEEYPNYVFHNPILDFDMPEISRVKKFEVTLEDGDILNMKTRVTLARIYLCEKEIKERELAGTLIEK